MAIGHTSLVYEAHQILFSVYLKAWQCLALSVECSKLNVIMFCTVTLIDNRMHRCNSKCIKNPQKAELPPELAIRLYKVYKVFLIAVPEVYTNRMRSEIAVLYSS